MPELPEVEVTRRQIASLLEKRVIADVITTKPSYFFLTPPSMLKRELIGRRCERLERRGKYLIAHLDDGRRLLLHLGMTGQLFGSGVASVRLLSSTGGGSLAPEQQRAAFEPDQHTHLRLRFEDSGREVLFRDTRKFGKVELLARDQPSERLDKLGVDALQATGALLHQATRTRATAIKNVLLDQAVIAGVGNIYADEALFLAQIRPKRAAKKVTRDEHERLAAAIVRVLMRSIETGGSSISDYVRPDGSDGGYQDERRVYGRSGESCLVCGSTIKRIVIGQRSTCYCPACQR
jgi:formamidopyrimidine-DNA glycosylase